MDMNIINWIMGLVAAVFMLMMSFAVKSIWQFVSNLKGENESMRAQIERVHTRMNALEVALSKIEVKQQAIEATLERHLTRMERDFSQFRQEVITLLRKNGNNGENES